LTIDPVTCTHVQVPHRVHNPPNPWQADHVDWEGEPPPAELHVYEETARSILARNDSPDVGFRWSLNPYRGCYHGCAYCYARPSHQHLGWGAGTDFERRIVVKTNAPELLRETFARRSWRGETIAFSGNTDCYQPLEASYRLTRRCLELCLEHRNPLGIITKSAVVRRDVDLLADLARETRIRVMISIPFADDATARRIEPWASPVSRRFDTMRILSDAGVPTGIGIAPLIPGLNDTDVPALLERAKDAGGSTAFMTLLRLPAEVRDVFFVRLGEVLPRRRRRVERAIRDVRDGALYDPAFGDRMRGRGERWRAIEAMFEAHRRRLGLVPRDDAEEDAPSPFRRRTRQLSLFEARAPGPGGSSVGSAPRRRPDEGGASGLP